MNKQGETLTMEKVKHRALRMVSGLRGSDYKERLKEFGHKEIVHLLLFFWKKKIGKFLLLKTQLFY